MYKVLPTDTRPMPLEVSSKSFATAWKKCFEGKRSDLTELFTVIQPFLFHWEQLLTNVEYNKDIHYISMCTRLSHDEDTALAMIRTWLTYLKRLDVSVQEELQFIMMRKIRNFRFFPEKAEPEVAEWAFAQYFKMGLLDRIQAISKKGAAVTTVSLEELEETHEYTYHSSYPDTMLVRSLHLDSWDSYLLYLLRQGTNSSGMSMLMHLPRATFFEEERFLWDSLRQKQSKS
jgi:hypothetical protein